MTPHIWMYKIKVSCFLTCEREQSKPNQTKEEWEIQTKHGHLKVAYSNTLNIRLCSQFSVFKHQRDSNIKHTHKKDCIKGTTWFLHQCVCLRLPAEAVPGSNCGVMEPRPLSRTQVRARTVLFTFHIDPSYVIPFISLLVHSVALCLQGIFTLFSRAERIPCSSSGLTVQKF